MLALKNQSRPCFNSVNNIVDVVTFPYHQSQTAHTDVFVLGGYKSEEGSIHSTLMWKEMCLEGRNSMWKCIMCLQKCNTILTQNTKRHLILIWQVLYSTVTIDHQLVSRDYDSKPSKSGQVLQKYRSNYSYSKLYWYFKAFKPYLTVLNTKHQDNAVSLHPSDKEIRIAQQ